MSRARREKKRLKRLARTPPGRFDIVRIYRQYVGMKGWIRVQ